MLKKLTDGKWEVNIKPGGRAGRQFRRTFNSKTDAATWQAWILSNATPNPEWKPEKRDNRKLSELIQIWADGHGKQLSAAADTIRRLNSLSQGMKNPPAHEITPSLFAKYRTQRLSEGISAATMNRELSYLRAMFNTLASLGEWSKPNPVENVKAFRVQETELSWLTLADTDKLLQECQNSRNPHVYLVAVICLSTGARWSEAESLRISQVKEDHLHLHHTKSKKVRNVPIDAELYKQIQEHHAEHSDGQQIFQYAWGAFREAIERAAIELPDGQMTHVLRHTFASHFMQNGGNILSLQRILGHSDLKTTMRYAHLAPGHLSDATELNPFTLLAKQQERENGYETVQE